MLGLGTAIQLHVLGQVWLWVSILLTVAAAGLLAGVILPTQRRVLAGLGSAGVPAGSGLGYSGPPTAGDPGDEPDPVSGTAGTAELSAVPDPARDALLARLGMLTGIFALLWAAVAVLMVFRPGSTTGA